MEFMLAKYQAELEILPTDTASEKNVGEEIFYILKCRDSKKTFTVYGNKLTVAVAQRQ